MGAILQRIRRESSGHYRAALHRADRECPVDRGTWSLTHRKAATLPHRSVAMEEIQDRRREKRIPNARALHDYVNLYFDAHNPMLSKCRRHNDSICVLRVEATVLERSGVIVSDRNAAADWVRFYPVTEGLQALEKELVFAEYWTNSTDLLDERRRKAVKCAEVLVPDSISPELLLGAYVANDRALRTYQGLDIRLPVVIKSSMFF
ncbi:MAG TPA: DUF4433 domain-containing protein [Nitrospiraceae bacterium]|nr:DUF4433 domain-containing protein [Nitrospiraceae bacterium]